jgi:hypothetical protein
MTFLAPLFLLAAGVASLVVVGLHFLVTRPPPLVAFPTTRFIPRTTIIVTSLARRPQDLLLLLLRVMALMLIGAAFARPVLVPRHRDVARIILADRGWSLASIGELRDSLARVYQPGDRLILVDSTAREVVEPAAESLATIERVSAPASLSAGLVAARRIASMLRLESDSIDLVLVSPLARESWDGATRALRAGWPGRIRLVPVEGRSDSLTKAEIALRARPDDPLRSALALLGPVVTQNERIRLARDSATAADSAWAAGGGALIVWPAALGAPRDSSSAVIGNGGAVVFPFERATELVVRAGSRVLARWMDGEPAATEWAVGAGCVRAVRIPVTPRGDFVLRPDFLRMVRELTGVCGGQGAVAPLDSAERAFLAGGPALTSREQLGAPEAPESPLVPWLFALAILLILLEPWLRRTPESNATAEAA